jgi:hypothetical protein
MISDDTINRVAILLIVIAFGVLVYGIARYIRWRIQQPPKPGFAETGEDPDELGFDLSCPLTRHRMQRMILKYGIVGSADVRDGKVYEPVSFDRMHPLLGVIDRANGQLQRLKNPQSCSLYIRDSVNDRFMLVPDLDLSDLREIAELLRAAVAERIARTQTHDE